MPSFTSCTSPSEPGMVGTPRLFHGCLGRGFIAHGIDLVGSGADELDAVFGADGGELGIFRQETIARMDGIGIGQFGSGYDIMYT